MCWIAISCGMGDDRADTAGMPAGVNPGQKGKFITAEHVVTPLIMQCQIALSLSFEACVRACICPLAPLPACDGFHQAVDHTKR